MTYPTRRRFLAISAMACATGALAEPMPETRWRGTALGAGASLRIVGLTAAAAAPILSDLQHELTRLEDIFSLYRPASAVSRLNRDGRLDAPPAELLEVLSLSESLHRATNGAFDPTVQPVFAAYAHAATRSRAPTPQELASARAVSGWDALSFDTGSVRLGRTGAALTLNGVAQGYITDRIAYLLRSSGFTNTLVDMGEIAALGYRPDGQAWAAGIAAPDGRLLRRLTLTDRALATSAPKGTVLDPKGETGHIFDLSTGREARAAAVIAVSAPSAAVADGLSTALCVLPAEARTGAVAAFPGARIEAAI